MAGDWIAIDHDLPDKQEVRLIVSRMLSLAEASVSGPQRGTNVPHNPGQNWDNCPGLCPRAFDTANVILLLIKLWRLADRTTEDGVIAGATPRTLVESCGGTDPFWRAVEEVGWLEIRPGEGVVIPAFTRRFGKSAKVRMRESKRKQLFRS